MYINGSKTLSFTLWALDVSYYLCFIIISTKTLRQRSRSVISITFVERFNKKRKEVFPKYMYGV